MNAATPYGSTWLGLRVPEGVQDEANSQPGIDTSGWESMPTPVGEHKTGAPPDSAWADIATYLAFSEAVWLRKDYTEDRMASVTLRYDCNYSVYANGVLRESGTTPGAVFPSVLVPVTVALPNEPGTLAIYARRKVRGGLDGWYLDIEVSTSVGLSVTRKWPRDDGAGFTGGPRLYPPPRSRRTVGGQL